MNTSYVVNDPGGEYYGQYVGILADHGYRVRCLNLIDMARSNHYNPFAYVRSDEDIAALADMVLAAAKLKGEQGGTPFLDKSEKALLTALIAYLCHYTEKRFHNFFSVMRLLNAGNLGAGRSSVPTPLDEMFDEVAEKDPDGFAVSQYKAFKTGCSEDVQKSILVSCSVRLHAFEDPDVMRLTDADDIALDSVGDEKTALFIILPASGCYCGFLATVLYAQLQRRLMVYAEETAQYASLVLDDNGQVVRTFRADSPAGAEAALMKAETFLRYVKTGTLFSGCPGSCMMYA